MRDSSLWFSTFKKLNDPFDGMVPWDFDDDETTIRRYWRAHAEDTGDGNAPDLEARIDRMVELSKTPEGRQQLVAGVAAEFDQFGVCCFNEVPDDLLMWSHYGDGLRGACLRFDTTGIFREFGIDRGLLLPIEYRETYPRVKFYRATDREKIAAVIATKATEWRQENEWRVVLPNEQGRVAFPRNVLTGAILGVRMGPEELRDVRELVRHSFPQAELFEAHPARDHYAVEVRQTA